MCGRSHSVSGRAPTSAVYLRVSVSVRSEEIQKLGEKINKGKGKNVSVIEHFEIFMIETNKKRR